MRYFILGAVLLTLGAGCAVQPNVVPPNPQAQGPNLELEATGLARQETIVMDATGFVPKELTIKKGTEVIFKNADTEDRWPASAPHPTHTNYPAFDPNAAVRPGASWSISFPQVGSFLYHDHLNPTRYGKIMVAE